MRLAFTSQPSRLSSTVSPVAVMHGAAGQFSQTYPQCLLRVAIVLVARRHPFDLDQLRHAPLAELVNLPTQPARAMHEALQFFLRRSPEGCDDRG